MLKCIRFVRAAWVLIKGRVAVSLPERSGATHRAVGQGFACLVVKYLIPNQGLDVCYVWNLR